MTVRSWWRRARRTLLARGTTAVLAAGALTGTATASQAATQGPCDIYAAGGTPCVAAHSTVRALLRRLQRHLYQVRRASDSTTAEHRRPGRRRRRQRRDAGLVLRRHHLRHHRRLRPVRPRQRPGHQGSGGYPVGAEHGRRTRPPSR